MIHDVPRGNDENEQLILTDLTINLDSDLRSYFRRKIVDSLTERGVQVVADDNEDASVRTSLASVLADSNLLVAASRDIATRLDDVQTRRNPAGLLAVITGMVDKAPCISVLKMEREQGLRFRMTNVDGHTVTTLNTSVT